MATLEEDLQVILKKLDLYSLLEKKAVRVIEAAKAEGAIHEGFKTEMGAALAELESYLEKQGFCFCSHCGSITQRSADEACECEEKE